jgi:hypothetical protein
MEILEEVRSTVLVWMKNVRNYVEETETYILNDEHTPPEIVDEGWVFFVARYLCYDPKLVLGAARRSNWGDATYLPYAEGVDAGRFWALRKRFWSTFIRRMIRSDVNTFALISAPRYSDQARLEMTDIVVGSRKENIDDKRGLLRLAVQFHERLSSEIKDEICSKLASALRALKSRISRICGINELERRVSLAPEAV